MEGAPQSRACTSVRRGKAESRLRVSPLGRENSFSQTRELGTVMQIEANSDFFITAPRLGLPEELHHCAPGWASPRSDPVTAN